MLRVSTLILFATVFATLLPRKKHMLRSRGISPVACFDKNFPLAATKRRVASFFGRSSAQEIESTRLGFFVKQTRNQRNSIERGMYTFARVLSRGRFFFFLVWPNRDAREPFHGRKFNFCHFARARNTTLSGSFPFRRSESRFHDEFTCIPTHDLKRPVASLRVSAIFPIHSLLKRIWPGYLVHTYYLVNFNRFASLSVTVRNDANNREYVRTFMQGNCTFACFLRISRYVSAFWQS